MLLQKNWLVIRIGLPSFYFQNCGWYSIKPHRLGTCCLSLYSRLQTGLVYFMNACEINIPQFFLPRIILKHWKSVRQNYNTCIYKLLSQGKSRGIMRCTGLQNCMCIDKEYRNRALNSPLKDPIITHMVLIITLMKSSQRPNHTLGFPKPCVGNC